MREAGRRAEPGTAPPVQLRAAEWLVELQADDLDEAGRQRLLAGLADWCRADPAHDAAWRRIEAMGQHLRPLAGTPASRVLAQAAQTAQAVPGRRRAVRHLALLLATGGAAGLAWRVSDEEGRTWLAALGAAERTGTAERRSLHLPDGTRLQLNAGTAVDIAYGQDARLVRLRAGDIHVETAHPPAGAEALAPPPFVVETRHGRVQALGTRFSVRQRDGQPTRVAVFEGAVDVRPREGLAPALRLRAGQQAGFDAQSAGPTAPADPAQAAWTRGVLVVHDMPLAEFVAELSRYRPGHLACDPAAGHLRVSGTYPLSSAADTDHALAMLAATLPVRLRQATRYWVSVEMRPEPP